jgi:cobalamin synthase
MSFPQKTLVGLACCYNKTKEVVARLVTEAAAATAALASRSTPGNATLVAGTIAVANTLVTANSVVSLTRKTIGGTTGDLSYTVSAGVGFTINSSSATDTSVISHEVIKY